MTIPEAITDIVVRGKALIDWLFLHIQDWSAEESSQYMSEFNEVLDAADPDQKQEIEEYFDQEKVKWETQHS